MDLKRFDTLLIRDFENGAIRDEIRKIIKHQLQVIFKLGIVLS